VRRRPFSVRLALRYRARYAGANSCLLLCLTPISNTPPSVRVGYEATYPSRVIEVLLYRRSENLFVLLHIVRKTTGAIPEADKQIASDRWDDFRARMDAPRRRPPRAAGHDAP